MWAPLGKLFALLVSQADYGPVYKPLACSQDLSKVCWGVEICSVVLRQRQKPHYISSSFGSTVFVASWHTLFLGGLGKRCPSIWLIHSCLLFVCEDDQLANLSAPFQNAMPLDTHESAKPPSVPSSLIHYQIFRNYL